MGLWAYWPLGRGGGLEIEFSQWPMISVTSLCDESSIRTLDIKAQKSILAGSTATVWQRVWPPTLIPRGGRKAWRLHVVGPPRPYSWCLIAWLALIFIFYSKALIMIYCFSEFYDHIQWITKPEGIVVTPS